LTHLDSGELGMAGRGLLHSLEFVVFSLWWVIMLASLIAAVSLTALSSIVANRYMHLILQYRRVDTSFTTATPASDLPMNPLLISTRLSRLRKAQRGQKLWSSVATKAYVTLVLLAVGAGLGNAVWGAPFWFPFLVLVLPFVGAFLVYRAWFFE
jgi:hypothetical protein